MIIVPLLALTFIYALYKLLIGGWLFKIILFCAGWVGIDILLRAYIEDSKHIAITLSGGTTIAWSELIPTIICFLCLLTTKVDHD